MKFYHLRIALVATILSTALPNFAQNATTSTVCEELPKGDLSEADLVRLVPDNLPGRVRVSWETETQENVYGFHIYRADTEGGAFRRITTAIIPGEGTTNIPKQYCFMDHDVARGSTYWYYIEEISTEGVATKLAETVGPEGKGTKVKAKTVSEERAWLKKKAAAAAAAPKATPTPRPTPPRIRKPVATPNETTEPLTKKVNPLE